MKDKESVTCNDTIGTCQTGQMRSRISIAVLSVSGVGGWGWGRRMRCRRLAGHKDGAVGKEYLAKLLSVFREDRRRLKDESVKDIFNYRGHHKLRMEEAVYSTAHSRSSSCQKADTEMKRDCWRGIKEPDCWCLSWLLVGTSAQDDRVLGHRTILQSGGEDVFQHFCPLSLPSDLFPKDEVTGSPLSVVLGQSPFLPRP